MSDRFRFFACFLLTGLIVVGAAPMASAATTVVATRAGVDSASSPVVVITIDQTAPSAPTILTPDEGALVPQRVNLTGGGELGATIELREGTTLLGTTVVSSTLPGRWSRTLLFAAGSHSVPANQVDAGGNRGPATGPRSFEVDTVAPTVVITSPTYGQIYTTLDAFAVTGTSTDEPCGQSLRGRRDNRSSRFHDAHPVCTERWGLTESGGGEFAANR